MTELPKNLTTEKTDDLPQLNAPYLVAVWPGMGHVAIAGGYYLLSKMNMTQLAEFRATDLFEVEQIEIKSGMVHTGRLPRSRLFYWKDPKQRHDIILFIGEAQPPLGKWAFSHRLLDFVQQLGVQRIFTFAAMATPMQPSERCRVFGVATDQEGVEQLQRLEVKIMDDGMITGLNGVLLAAGAERGLRGMGLLGEMPFYAPQVPFPKASAAVLEVFNVLAEIDVNLNELREHGRVMEQTIANALEQIQQTQPSAGEDDDEDEPGMTDVAFMPPDELPPPQAPDESDTLSEQDEQLIEKLFAESAKDRSRAYDLKKELDRLGVFERYEDRFLDLFKRPES
ncbi:hypothetical protein HED60_11750 [Planctomycetales bacterium ZRK34]|nr:hypothetical protein HED60_11750 [Planctomycetales bacterium ZRK34]